MLIRRVREACKAGQLLHVGTSATLASGGTWTEQQTEVARVATDIFGAPVKPEFIIGETLRRVTLAASHQVLEPRPAFRGVPLARELAR